MKSYVSTYFVALAEEIIFALEWLKNTSPLP